MSGLISNIPLVSAGGAATAATPDISATYTTLAPQTSNYTVTDNGSVVVPVNTTSAGFTVTLNDAVSTNTRVRIHDSFLNCGTNPVVVNNGSAAEIGKLNTDGGAIEFAWSGASWVLIDRFENMFERNELTGELTPREAPDSIVASKIRAGSASPVVTKGVSDFTNPGANIDQDAGSWGSVAIPLDDTDNITALSGDLTNYANLFDSDGFTYANLTGTKTLELDGGSTKTFSSIQLVAYHGNSSDLDTVEILTGPSETGPWTTHETIDNTDNSIFDSGSDGNYATIDVAFTPVSTRYLQISMTNPVGIAGFRIYSMAIFLDQFATTDNTFDINFSSGVVGSFIPSTLALRDESSNLILGDNALIEYQIDNGGFQGGGGNETWNRYTIPQNQPGHTFLEHIKVTAGESFNLMIRKQTGGSDGTSTSHYGTSAEDASSETEIQNLVADALDDFSSPNTSGDSITGNTDIIIAEQIASQDNLGTQTVHIYFKDNSGNRVALSDTFEIVVDTTNTVSVEARYSNEATDSGGTTFSDNNPSTAGTVDVNTGSSGALTPTQFRALSELSFTTGFDLRVQPVGSQRISKVILETPDTATEMTLDGMISKVAGVEVGAFTSSGTKMLVVTTTERDNLSSPADGTVVYNSTTNKLNIRANGAWEEITSS
jgi:hypothetical protein